METNNDQQESTVLPNDPLPTPPSSRKKMPIILGVLFLALLAAGGAYYMKMQGYNAPTQQKQSTAPTATQNISPTDFPTPTLDAKTNWKTYSNSKYNISFQYPATLSNACCDIAGPITGNFEKLIVLADESTTQQGTDKAFDGIGVYVVPHQNFTTYIEEEKEAQLRIKKEFTGNNTPGIQTPAKLSNQEGVILKGYSWDALERLYVPFPNNQYVLVISKNQQSQDFQTLYNQILSTFILK